MYKLTPRVRMQYSKRVVPQNEVLFEFQSEQAALDFLDWWDKVGEPTYQKNEESKIEKIV